MKVVIIGTGYVGLVTGACLAKLGNNVLCLDIDKKKIEGLKIGQIPFYEPDLRELVAEYVGNSLNFSSLDDNDVLDDAQIIFIAVGTPPKESGEADLSYVKEVAGYIGKNLKNKAVIVDKSTVPVGTAQKVHRIIKQYYDNDFSVASNPEFLREGSAVKDFLNPDRLVIGCDDEYGFEVMQKLYKDFICPKIECSTTTAELIKYAANAFLATKISFINEIANVCELVGADVEKVSEGMGLDKRIGKQFLNAGIGYGGSCFPKDVRALQQIAGRNCYNFQLLKSVIEVNNQQKWLFFQKIKNYFKDLNGIKIGIWGLAFKANTDDIRESVAIELINRFLEEGAQLRVYDPKAMEVAKKQLDTPSVVFCKTKEEVLEGVDCLVIATEWSEFSKFDFDKKKVSMAKPIVFDGRNLFNSKRMADQGVDYFSVGR